jgi:hypothetical protein
MMMQSKRILLSAFMFAAVLTTTVRAQQNDLRLEDRAVYRRAMEVVNWSQPLMSFKAMRDAFFALGGDFNDVGYFSKVQNWKFQRATPNSTTPYVATFWNLKNGPIVVEIPASTEDVGVFGTRMDSWPLLAPR